MCLFQHGRRTGRCLAGSGCPLVFAVVPRIPGDSGREFIVANGGCGQVDCKCSHVPFVGWPRYLTLEELSSPYVTRFMNCSMVSCVCHVGFRWSPVILGTYRVN